MLKFIGEEAASGPQDIKSAMLTAEIHISTAIDGEGIAYFHFTDDISRYSFWIINHLQTP